MYQNEGNDISLQDYPNGYTLYAFDLSPDSSCGSHLSLVKRGNLRLDIHFAHPVVETISVTIYTEFNNVIEIDQARDILFDYGS